MESETIFWIGHLPLMVLFLVGMADVAGVWLSGRVEGQAGRSAVRKGLALLGSAISAVFSRRFPLVVKTFVTEAWFNRRLWRASRWRWLNHFLLLSGFMLLMVLSGISAVADKVIIHFFHLEHVAVIGMWVNPDHPVTALLNEAGAVMMTAGFIFFVLRRYAFRVSQLRTGPMDTWMVIGLGLILLSGWVAEIVRLNSAHAVAPSFYSFVGYPISLLVAGLRLPWDTLFEWLYAGHGLLTSVIIVTIPYSKFMHAIAGGLAAWTGQFREEAAASGGAKGVSHVGA